MRCFFALDFSPRFCRALDELGRELCKNARQGRLTKPENYHLTLAFLGDQPQIAPLEAALAACDGAAFTLVTAQPGVFRQQSGDLLWLGLADSPPLRALQRSLTQELERAGVVWRRQAFRPHLTLARGVRWPEGSGWNSIAELPPLYERIDRLSLIRSDLGPGGPVYTELCGRALAGAGRTS